MFRLQAIGFCPGLVLIAQRVHVSFSINIRPERVSIWVLRRQDIYYVGTWTLWVDFCIEAKDQQLVALRVFMGTDHVV